jgi:hypothetical protein
MLDKSPRKMPTIRSIFDVQIIRYKAFALLGIDLAEIELKHDIFHGIASDITPKEGYQEVKLKIGENNDSNCYFMGRNLDMEENTEPKDQAGIVEKFFLKIVGEKKYNILLDNWIKPA